MKFLGSIKKIFFIFDHTDEEVQAIYKQPMKKADDVNKSLKVINKLLYHKSVTYKIAQATGALK